MQNYDIIDLAGLRIDGRKPDESRHLRHRIGVIDYADGSAYMEQGLNKVLAIVHGPREPKKKPMDAAGDQCNISVKIISAPFSGTERKRKVGVDRRNLESETIIRKIFEEMVMTHLYPKSEVTIVVHTFEADGSTLCCLINAVTLALLSAGISMSDMISACSIGYVKGNLCMDLTQTEQNLGGAYMPVVVKASDEEIVYMQVDNRLSLDDMETVLHRAVKGAKVTKRYMESAIRAYMDLRVRT